MTSKPFRAGRTVVAALLWITLAVGGLREGLEWALHTSMTRILGVPAPEAEIHLLSLEAVSAAGEGQWREVAVRWRGLHVRLLGPARVELLEVGPPIVPIMRVRNATLDHLWPLLSGRATKVEISPLRTEWRRLLGPGEAKVRALRIPLNVTAPLLVISTPTGQWEGPCAVEGEGFGGRGRWSATLRSPAGLLEGSGRWQEGRFTGEATFRGQVPAEGHGTASWSPESLTIQVDLTHGSERWTADVLGKPGSAIQLAITHEKPGDATQILAARLLPGDPSNGGWPLVADLVGKVALPDIRLGTMGTFKEGVLSADPQDPRLVGATCLALLARGRVSGLARSRMLRAVVQVRQGADGGAEAFFEGYAAPAPTPMIEVPLPSLSWSMSGRRSPSGGGLLEGTIKSAEATLSLKANIGEGGISWDTSLRHEAGWLDARGSWLAGTWQFAGRGKLERDIKVEAPVPVPSGALSGEFFVGGNAGGITAATVKAAGAGSWNFSMRKTGWTFDVHNGVMKGGGAALEGVDASGRGLGYPSILLGHPFAANARVRECTLSGNMVRNTVASMKVDPRGLSIRVSTDPDLLEGTIGATLRRDLSPGAVWRVEDGRVNILRGAVVFDGVRGTLPWPALESGQWTCPQARIYGEPLRDVSGQWWWDGAAKVSRLEAKVAHWGGTLEAGLSLGPNVPADLVVRAQGVKASAILPYIKQWIDLPLALGRGTVDGSVTIPLEHADDGLHLDVALRDADLGIMGKERALAAISGKFSGTLAGGRFNIPNAPMTLDGGKASAEFSVSHADGVTTVAFFTPTMPAATLQDAVLEFLPEYFAYGTMEGQATAAGKVVIGADESHLEGALALKDYSFVSEDRSFRIKGANGTIPLLVQLKGQEGQFRGFASLSRSTSPAVFKGLGETPEGSSALTVDRLRFSVFFAENLRLSTGTTDGAVWGRLTGGSIWGGAMRGQARLYIGQEGMRYAGQVLLNDASLKAFCEQSGALRGFIEGRFDGGLTFGGDSEGLGQVKALADLWALDEAEEPRVISRDFLIKMGGENIRRLIHSDILEYDKASLRCGLTGGILTVYELDLSHKANPVKALVRKDVSFEVRVPQRNSIAVQQLMGHIKDLEARSSGPVQPPAQKKKKHKR